MEMPKVQLQFSTNAKLEKLIGRELITNNVIAIFELIKNSYDASAHNAVILFEGFEIVPSFLENNRRKDKVVSGSQSKIIVSDDGYGMSFEEVQTKWMEIGTSSKEGLSDANEGQRVINGEKGIGRFGTDRLGESLKLVSVGASGYERTTLWIDWNRFDDHQKKIQDFDFDCEVERLSEPIQTGLTLEISSLRDIWCNGDIIKLKKQLKKLVSPFSQEQNNFQIYLDYGNNHQERIVNDSFEYATTGIEVELASSGAMDYEIFSTLESIKETVQIGSPSFGPVKLKILYMDRAAKNAFARRTGTPTKDYGNIKLFRDDFRVLPYGEKENDWLGIDNKHAQGTFRTFGTRDLIGYVQISKQYNPALKDVTSRQGLNEDIKEFDDFKEFIWQCITLLQDYVFNRIRQESEKQGEIIKDKVKVIQKDIIDFQNEIPLLYEDLHISDEDKNKLIQRTNDALQNINANVATVEQANRQLSSRVKVMEKVVGAETRLYDMLHAVKNRLAALDAIVLEFESKAQESSITYDSAFAKKTIRDISNMVLAAMRRSSPKRKKRDVIILSDFVQEFIDESKIIYPDIQFEFNQDNYYRIFINVEELKISLENMLDNSIKAMRNVSDKKILIYIIREKKNIRLYFEDNGMGVPPEYAPFIFNVSFSKTDGSGIGLSNVLDFMKEEGGDINLMEKGRLKGASFEMTFPIKGGIA